MRFLGVCVGTLLAVVAAGVGGAGCDAGGTLTGAGGGGTLSGLGGKTVGGRGGGSVMVGTGGVGPATGTAGSGDTYGCGLQMPADPVPAKIVIVLDTSASMNDAPDGSCTGGCGSGSKWSAVVGGIDAVVGANDPPVAWGLEFIGSAGDTCDAGGIEVPAAPNSGGAVMSALARRTVAAALAVSGNTPTRAALSVATTHILGLFTPGNAAILLVTDGQADCAAGATDPRASDSAAALQMVTYATTAGVPTFVVGVGAFDPATDDALSRMAVEGGYPRSGSPAYDPVADARGVVNAINEVVATVGTCLFAVPPPPTSNGSTTRDRIAVYAGDKQVPQDANDGWTYGDSTHTTVTFNGAACDAVHAGTVQQVTVAFLCLI